MNIRKFSLKSTIYMKNQTINFTDFEIEQKNNRPVVWLYFANELVGTFHNSTAEQFIKRVGAEVTA